MAQPTPGQLPAAQPDKWVYWPGLLPDCTAGWSEAPVDPKIRTEMEVGMPKTRRRGTGRQRDVAFTMNLSNPDGGANELAMLLRDFYELAGDGTAHTGNTNGGVYWWPFKSPLDDLYHFYRFTKPPVITNSGPLTFRAAIEVEEYLP